jgi:hypothetical protein
MYSKNECEMYQNISVCVIFLAHSMLNSRIKGGALKAGAATFYCSRSATLLARWISLRLKFATFKLRLLKLNILFIFLPSTIGAMPTQIPLLPNALSTTELETNPNVQ